ncbi:MAG TPA: hypothetical protein VGF53_18215 [Pseudolabrys sp.]|jgi:hypothetical protein
MKLRQSLPIALAALSTIVVTAAAQDTAAPQLHTNEAYIAEMSTQTQKIAIDDPMAVFAYVLGSLPERAKVYPTENHYYFWFDLNGTRYAGNIKIDARLRAEGKVVFSYYEDRATWLQDTEGTGLILGSPQGVTVEQVEPLAYRVSYGKKSVVFALNDLSQIKPPAAALAPNDRFIGPIFDESGIRFFLVFNAKLNLFHYILDETIKPADVFVPAPVGNGRILIGKRTGFAVYRDQHRDRKILIGVFHDNVVANNFLDGPFDQMPDNFIEGDSFQQAILAVEPKLKGQINRFGSFADGGRFVLEPYMEYRSPKDLAIFDRCASSRHIAAQRYEACFALPLEGSHDADARPLAMQRRAP